MLKWMELGEMMLSALVSRQDLIERVSEPKRCVTAISAPGVYFSLPSKVQKAVLVCGGRRECWDWMEKKTS